MEMTVKLVKRLPAQTRQWTDRNGQPQTLAIQPMLLRRGADTLYAELVGDAAASAERYTEGAWYVARIDAYARPWRAQDGTDRYSNDLALRALYEI